ncbi:MAG: hypothetical protein ACKO3N_17770 [Verrucomicrobiota bacterium]
MFPRFPAFRPGAVAGLAFRPLLPLLLSLLAGTAQAQVRLATFDVDASPPPNTELTYDPLLGNGELTLRCRGVVLLGAGEPLVLCAVDWIGIANEGHDFFRDALARAAGTPRSRVAVHTLHQHDAPVCDFTAERILRGAGKPPGPFDGAVTRPTIERAAAAVRAALTNTQPVSQVGFGRAEVHQVASNRRLPGPDGKIRAVRYTACPDPALRAEPEGTIDPFVDLVSFWDGERPVAVLSYYAIHPQSYYRTGIANPDFPGIARFLRDQALPGVLHVHFDGAGGNLGAGKYNDGSRTNRAVLAGRLADGMRRAWEATRRQPLAAADVGWTVEAVDLPSGAHLQRAPLAAQLQGGTPSLHVHAAKLAWLERQESGRKLEIPCLRLGAVRVLHLPGELFVEYQLAAKKMRPDLQVAMAAYGDYGTAYIGTRAAYPEGGYETGPNASFVAPGVEDVLMAALRRLLGAR